MKPKWIYLKRWPFSKKTAAVTISPFIFHRDKVVSAELKRHEEAHIKQAKKLGWLKFYGSYINEHLKRGYKRNKYEQEATKAEGISGHNQRVREYKEQLKQQGLEPAAILEAVKMRSKRLVDEYYEQEAVKAEEMTDDEK